MAKYINYIRVAMEKDASFMSGAKRFLSRPIDTTIKKVFWDRAPAKEWLSRKTVKGAGKELLSGADFSTGMLATGVVASPFMLKREI